MSGNGADKAGPEEVLKRSLGDLLEGSSGEPKVGNYE